MDLYQETAYESRDFKQLTLHISYSIYLEAMKDIYAHILRIYLISNNLG